MVKILTLASIQGSALPLPLPNSTPPTADLASHLMENTEAVSVSSLNLEISTSPFLSS